MQAKNAKLQKEMSLRLDTLRITSQDSGVSLGGTGKKTFKRSFLDSSMGRTGPRRTRESPLARKVNFQDTAELDFDDDDALNETSRTELEKVLFVSSHTRSKLKQGSIQP